MLIEHMKYFDKYTKDGGMEMTQKLRALDELDITVQWSHDVFRWILGYIEGNKEATFKSNEVMSILISADALMINDLVNEWLTYISQNLEKVVKFPGTNQQLKSSLVKKLSKIVTLDALDSINNSNLPLIERLYKKKLETLHLSLECPIKSQLPINILQNPKDFLLQKWVLWNELYTNLGLKMTPCAEGKYFITPHGQLLPPHQKCEDWNINDYVINLRRLDLSWKQIYYKIWALSILLFCTECQCSFRLIDYEKCRYHPDKGSLVRYQNLRCI